MAESEREKGYVKEDEGLGGRGGVGFPCGLDGKHRQSKLSSFNNKRPP